MNKVVRSGFTLIELLVVISIVSVLSSIVLSSVVDAREKALDAAHTNLAKSTKTALIRYQLNNSSYPQPPEVFIGEERLEDYLVPTYMVKISPNGDYSLTYVSDRPNEFVVYMYYGNENNCKFGEGSALNNFYPGVNICNY